MSLAPNKIIEAAMLLEKYQIRRIVARMSLSMEMRNWKRISSDAEAEVIEIN